jgi:uncharacterized protein
MRCPNCGARLVELERSEVNIDACPECRGVWLDRGELDRILAKERQAMVADPDEDFFREMEGRPRQPVPSRPPEHESRWEDEREHKKKRRKRSLLEDLFDFD